MAARAMACLMAWPAITAPWVSLKPPRTDFARPVRAVETMTACFMRPPVANLAAQPLGCQGRVAQGEGDGACQRHQADGDAAIKRQSGIEGDRAVGSGHGGKGGGPN